MRPVELLVFLELIKVFFQTLLRFHKFQVCSIFKVLRCCPLAKQLIYYISFVPVCQGLFEIFFEEVFDLSDKLESRFSEPLCGFRGCVSRGQLRYNTTPFPFCQHLFSIFFDNTRQCKFTIIMSPPVGVYYVLKGRLLWSLRL